MVNKIGPDYIGLLVLGVFNAAIGRQNIRSDLQYRVQVTASSSVAAALHTMSVVLWKCSGCKGQSPRKAQHGHQATVLICENGIHTAQSGCRPTAGLARGTLDMSLKRAVTCCSLLTSKFESTSLDMHDTMLVPGIVYSAARKVVWNLKSMGIMWDMERHARQ